MTYNQLDMVFFVFWLDQGYTKRAIVISAPDCDLVT
jgi:hypothetical protein